MPACPNRSRLIIRRPAAPAATASPPRPGCSGAPRISRWPAGASAPRSSRRASAGERERLNALAALVETAGCRRALLLRHFGEDPPASCGNCDNCLSPPQAIDATTAAQKLLSAAFRTEMRFGIGHLTDVLAGRETDKVHGFGHHRLSVFGIADADELALVKPVARALLARDALRADDFGGLSFGPSAKPILKGEAKVEIVLPPKRTPPRSGRKAADYPHDPLFEALRARRRELAAEAGVPPYVIFHDSTLREMAELKPATLHALSRISGVGAAKLERYGAAFVEVVQRLGSGLGRRGRRQHVGDELGVQKFAAVRSSARPASGSRSQLSVMGLPARSMTSPRARTTTVSSSATIRSARAAVWRIANWREERLEQLPPHRNRAAGQVARPGAGALPGGQGEILGHRRVERPPVAFGAMAS